MGISLLLCFLAEAPGLYGGVSYLETCFCVLLRLWLLLYICIFLAFCSIFIYEHTSFTLCYHLCVKFTTLVLICLFLIVFGLSVNLMGYLWFSSLLVFTLFGGLTGVLILSMRVGVYYFIIGLESHMVLVGVVKVFYSWLVLFFRRLGYRLLCVLQLWVAVSMLDTFVFMGVYFYGLRFKLVLVCVVLYGLLYILFRRHWSALALIIRLPRSLVFIFKTGVLVWGWLMSAVVVIFVAASTHALAGVYVREFVYCRWLFFLCLAL